MFGDRETTAAPGAALSDPGRQNHLDRADAARVIGGGLARAGLDLSSEVEPAEGLSAEATRTAGGESAAGRLGDAAEEEDDRGRIRRSRGHIKPRATFECRNLAVYVSPEFLARLDAAAKAAAMNRSEFVRAVVEPHLPELER
jgi:hypothetical protein